MNISTTRQRANQAAQAKHDQKKRQLMLILESENITGQQFDRMVAVIGGLITD